MKFVPKQIAVSVIKATKYLLISKILKKKANTNVKISETIFPFLDISTQRELERLD